MTPTLATHGRTALVCALALVSSLLLVQPALAAEDEPTSEGETDEEPTEGEEDPEDPDLPENEVDEIKKEETEEAPTQDALPIDSRVPDEPFPDPPAEEAAEDAIDPYRLEPTILPLVAYSTDRGFGVGFLGGVVKNHPNYDPHRWGLRGRALIFLGPKPGGGLRVPYQSYAINFTAPHARKKRIGFAAVLGFRQVSTANYFGIGNAAVNERPWEQHEEGTSAFEKAERYYDYGLTRLWGGAQVRITISPQVFTFAGGRFGWNWADIREDTKLQEDLTSDDENVTRFLVLDDNFGTFEAEGGIVFSSLDRPTSPSQGMLHELSFRGGPTFGAGGTHGYGGVNAQLRFFLPMLEDRLVGAYRILLDGVFGNPPLPELARYGGTEHEFGIGGGNGIRGVPRQRYHGKIKMISNLEVRSVILRTKLARRSFDVGAVVFFDTGRIWADWQPAPEFDGAGFGFKAGVGGGLRIQWGPNFVFRTDVAWSPDGVGVYIDAGHAF